MAVGYPGLKFLDDLQEYRETYQDYTRVVNAYEPHEHVYEDLLAAPGRSSCAVVASSPRGSCSG